MLTPPTDNLYKFIAIFGLVLIIAGLALPYQAERDFSEQHVERMVEDAKIGNTLIEQSKKSLELAGELSPISKTVDPVVAAEQLRILKEMKKLSVSRDELERAPSFIRAQQRYEYAKDLLERAINNSVRLLAIGAVLSTLGFWLWYERVQKHLDKAARAGR